jgi:MFS family permease
MPLEPSFGTRPRARAPMPYRAEPAVRRIAAVQVRCTFPPVGIRSSGSSAERSVAIHRPGGNLGKLAVLMITAFVDMVGLLMVLPLLPFYAVELGGSGLAVGVLVSSYALAQLISAPLWGRVSDRYGRRPALMIGLGASAVAYVIFGFATSLWMLLASRLVQGAGGGTVGVIQAYVADSTEPQNRTRSLGWLSAATNVGVMVGPALGSVSSVLGPAAPGLLAAGLCVLNMGFAWRFLPESHVPGTPPPDGVRTVRSREAVLHVVRHAGEPAPRLIWIYAIGMGGFQAITAVLALFLALRFGITEMTIGYVFMFTGAVSVVTRAGLLGPAVDRLGEARLSRVGITLLAAGLLLISFSNGYPMLAVALILVPLGTAFTFPCVTAMLSQVIGRHERGLYMGVQQTYGGIARVLGPIGAGWAWDNLGAPVPFWIAAALVLSTLFLGIGMERRIRPDPEPAATLR